MIANLRIEGLIPEAARCGGGQGVAGDEAARRRTGRYVFAGFTEQRRVVAQRGVPLRTHGMADRPSDEAAVSAGPQR